MPRTRTGDPAHMREINLSILLYALRNRGALSRAALAAETGLTKVTVSSLISQLIRLGFVAEGGINKAGLGRPGTLLALNPRAGGILAAEIGVDFISIVLCDFAAKPLWRNRESTHTNAPQTEILERVISNIRIAARHAKKQQLDILGLTLGVPGLVDVASGTLLYAPNLKWENVPLADILSEKFAFPVYVDNESSIAAFGETMFGVARGMQNMAYVYAGVGVGGGLVVNGRIMTGATGFAGEIGHVTLEPDGPVCNCGNYGCWETLASQSAVFHRVEQAIDRGTPSSLARYKHNNYEDLTISAIVRAADEGDPVARQALCETGRYFGIGISNLVNTLNPEIVVIGGSLSAASTYLIPVIEQTLAKRALRWARQATRVVVAANGSDACTIGGVAIVYDQVLQHPQSFRKSVVA